METTADNASGNRTSDQYEVFLESIQKHFDTVVKEAKALFSTDTPHLFDVFLENIPTEAQRHYTCGACKYFVNRYGGLAVIDHHGSVEPIMWDEDVPAFFAPAAKAMRKAIQKAKVTGVFLSGASTLGYPKTGEWNHLSVRLPDSLVLHSRLQTPNQVIAEKAEDFRTLTTALDKYHIDVVDQALALLKTEALYRSEKCLGVAEWFKNLHVAVNGVSGMRNKENLKWLAVGTAPAGFCHVNSSMIGTLLEDIAAGMDFDAVSRRFAEKMHPLKYQRPQAAPLEGNIAQAEKIVEKLGIQKSLIRRFARLDEVEKIWIPKEHKDEKGGHGIFSHLVPKRQGQEPSMNTPAITMTWRKFLDTVLPTVESIEYFVEEKSANYSAILTAAHDEAPPILQWDNEARRNPFSQYVYHGGSSPSRWNLSPGYCAVTAICYQPSMWYGDYGHQSKSVFFLLDGAKDSGYKRAGSAIFPETLKAELREIRSTIEAYSRKAVIEGYEEASACGIKLEYRANWDARFRVKTNLGTATYRLDRWD